MKRRSLFELAEQVKMEYEEQECRERLKLAAALSAEIRPYLPEYIEFPSIQRKLALIRELVTPIDDGEEDTLP